MKKVDLLKVWELVKNGKFGKVSGDGKIKYVKILAKLSPVVKDYETYRDTITEKLMSEHENFRENLQEAQAYEAYQKDNTLDKPKMSKKEYEAFVQVVMKYNQDVAAALTEEADKELDVKYDKLTPTEFGCFCDSNDFTGEQAMSLAELMCEMD